MARVPKLQYIQHLLFEKAKAQKLRSGSVVIGLRPEGHINRQAIQDILCRPEVTAALQTIPTGPMLEVCNPMSARWIKGKMESPDGTIFHFGLGDVEAELRNYGVAYIWRQEEGEANRVIFKDGIQTAIDNMYAGIAKRAKAGNPDTICPHFISTIESPGPSAFSVATLAHDAQMDFMLALAGIGSPLGIMATGSQGAVTFVSVLGHRLKAAYNSSRHFIVMLCGGGGTRIKLAQYKGEIVVGDTSLNAVGSSGGSALSHHLNPVGSDALDFYVVLKPNDGTDLPFNMHCWIGWPIDIVARIAPELMLDGYFQVAPYDSSIISPEDSKRLGMVALDSRFPSAPTIVTTEKKGVFATTYAAIKRIVQGKNFSSQEVDAQHVRICLNYFTTAFRKNLADELRQVLDTVIRPNGHTVDEFGDFDTFSLYFAVAVSDTPEDFRARIADSNLPRWLTETATDKLVYVALRRALLSPTTLKVDEFEMCGLEPQPFITAILNVIPWSGLGANQISLTAIQQQPNLFELLTAGGIEVPRTQRIDDLLTATATYRSMSWAEIEKDEDKDKQSNILELNREILERSTPFADLCPARRLRVGFLELGHGSIAFDLGTVESFLQTTMAMTESWGVESVLREKLLRTRQVAQQASGDLQANEWDALEREQTNTARITRTLYRQLFRLEPNLLLQQVQFTPVTKRDDAPILGVNLNDYDIPQSVRNIITTADGIRQLRQIIRNSRKTTPLVEVKDAQGRFLYLHDPEGINTVNLNHCRVHPGTVIGRGVLGWHTEFGAPGRQVYIAEDGQFGKARIMDSVTHPGYEMTAEKAERFIQSMETAAKASGPKKEVTFDIGHGASVIMTPQGTLKTRAIMQQVGQGAIDAAQREGRLQNVAEQFSRAINTGGNDFEVLVDTGSGSPDVIQVGNGPMLPYSDPAKVLMYTGRLSTRRLPYVVYNAIVQVGKPILVEPGMVYTEIQERTGTGSVLFPFPFDVNPKTFRVPGFYNGTVKLADAAMRDFTTPFPRTEWLDDRKLQQRGSIPGICLELNNIFTVLTADRGVPVIDLIDQGPLQTTIENALAGGRNIVDAIVDFTRINTPNILGRWIAAQIGRPYLATRIEANITTAQQLATRSHKFHPRQILGDLGLDAEQTRAAMDAINSYPFSADFLTTNGYNERLYRIFVTGLVERFRAVPKELVEFDPNLLMVDHAVALDHQPISAHNTTFTLPTS